MACETRGNNSEVNDDMLRRARDVIAGAAAMHGLEWQLDVVGGAPLGGKRCGLRGAAGPLCPGTAARCRGGGCFPLPRIREQGDMGASDDATTLMRAVQAEGGLAAYAFLGADLAAGHHQPGFDFDEAVLWPVCAGWKRSAGSWPARTWPGHAEGPPLAGLRKSDPVRKMPSRRREKAPQACGTGGCRHVMRSCPDFSTLGNIFYNYLYAQDNFLMEPLPSSAGPVEKCCFPHSGRKITAPAAVCSVNSLR